MTAKQMRFCDEYLIDLNATQAAIRAGYSEKYANTNASKLLRITTIKEFIAARMEEKKSKLIADQDEVLEFLTAVMRGDKKDERMVFAKDGPYTFEIKNQENQMRAAELLGKRYGLYKDTINEVVDMELNVTVDYGDGGSE